MIAFAANSFDTQYEKRMSDAWKKDGQRFSHFIVRNLSTDLFLMARDGKAVKRVTRFAEEDWKRKTPYSGKVYLEQRRKDDPSRFNTRSNVTGKKRKR